MADIVNKATRSRMMSGIRGRNTRPELILRKALHRLGFRYRLHDRCLPGQPDLIFPRYRAIIFVHGCFWHRHQGCSLTSTPSSNTGFWGSKFEDTLRRDSDNMEKLRQMGWRLAVIWECALRGKSQGMIAIATGEWLKSADPELLIPDMPRI